MDNVIIQQLLDKAEEDQIEKIVVGAFIVKSNRILILSRPLNDFMGGIYELPSGNLEKGEELLEGLKREVKEETNLDIERVVDYIDYFDYTSGSGKKARQFNFYILVKEGEIKLTEHDNYKWTTKEDKEFGMLTENVKESIDKLFKLLEREDETQS